MGEFLSAHPKLSRLCQLGTLGLGVAGVGCMGYGGVGILLEHSSAAPDTSQCQEVDAATRQELDSLLNDPIPVTWQLESGRPLTPRQFRENIARYAGVTFIPEHVTGWYLQRSLGANSVQEAFKVANEFGQREFNGLTIRGAKAHEEKDIRAIPLTNAPPKKKDEPSGAESVTDSILQLSGMPKEAFAAANTSEVVIADGAFSKGEPAIGIAGKKNLYLAAPEALTDEAIIHETAHQWDDEMGCKNIKDDKEFTSLNPKGFRYDEEKALSDKPLSAVERQVVSSNYALRNHREHKAVLMEAMIVQNDLGGPDRMRAQKRLLMGRIGMLDKGLMRYYVLEAQATKAYQHYHMTHTN